MNDGDSQVTYPVRDLLEKIKLHQKEGFARVEAALVSKADKMDVARMEVRLEQNSDAITDLRITKADKADVDALAEWKQGQTAHEEHVRASVTKVRWAIGAGASVIMVIATVIAPYLAVHVHL